MWSHTDQSLLGTQLVNSRGRVQTWVPGCTFPSVPQSHLALLDHQIHSLRGSFVKPALSCQSLVKELCHWLRMGRAGIC